MSAERELFTAIQVGDLAKVTSLLESDKSLIRARNQAGVSALLWAQYTNRKEIADALLKQYGECDVFEASALGLLDRVAALLKADPDLANAVASDGFSPLGLAAFFGRKDVATLLLEHGADPNAASRNAVQVRPIHSAAANGDHAAGLAISQSLLDKGADPNAAQSGGWTPLHEAAAHGKKDLARLLLDRGADTEARNAEGQTPLDLARKNGQGEVAALLRQFGAAAD
jgi:ankyrin repeat protein